MPLPATIQYSSDRNSPLNKARRRYHNAKRLLSSSARGLCSKSVAMKEVNRARAHLKAIVYGKAKTYVPSFETTVSGIPCGVVVNYFRKGYKAKTWGRPEDCYPGEPDEAGWFLVDRKGYRAQWLQNRMSIKDEGRIDEMAIEYGRQNL